MDSRGRELQQVSSRPATSAIVIDPRRLPVGAVPRRRSLRPLANINRFWVLHRQWILRGIAGVACAALLAVAFQARGGIAQAVTSLSNIMQGEFAAAGLGIGQISMTGQSLTHERDIMAALEIGDDVSILSYDAELARQRVLALPAITDASVRKIYPNQIVVAVTERQPLARWTVSVDETFVIDAAGKRIGTALPVDDGLPLIIGEGGGDNALVIIRALERYPDVSVGLAAISRLADRRWDLIYESGLRVKLPETGVAQALQALQSYQQDYQMLDRNISQIDLRVDGVVSVRPIVEASED